MRYLLKFKTMGQLQDNPKTAYKPSEGETRSVDEIMTVATGTSDWKSRKSYPDQIIEGPTFTIASKKLQSWAHSYETMIEEYLDAYYELMSETDQLVWDQYYCAALTGLLANHQSGTYEQFEEAARGIADRGIAARRKITGDSV